MIESLSNEKANMILQELQVECESLFEFKIKSNSNSSWLVKLEVETRNGCRNFVLKQYNKERYKLYDPLTLLQALHQQQRLHNNGISCPKLLTYKNNVMHTSKIMKDL